MGRKTVSARKWKVSKGFFKKIKRIQVEGGERLCHDVEFDMHARYNSKRPLLRRLV